MGADVLCLALCNDAQVWCLDSYKICNTLDLQQQTESEIELINLQ
jgi:hypothetical protein